MAAICKKYKVSVKMKRPWTNIDSWVQKPTKNNVIERFREILQDGRTDDLLEVTIEEA